MWLLGGAKIEEHHKSEDAAQTIRATNDRAMTNILTITENNTTSCQVQLVSVITPPFNQRIWFGNVVFGLSDSVIR
jgi:hypothetical protein